MITRLTEFYGTLFAIVSSLRPSLTNKNIHVVITVAKITDATRHTSGQV